jgi:hypothetical protein
MREVWANLSLTQPPDSPGHVAYAKKKAAMYARMEMEAEARFDKAGFRELRLKAANDYGALLAYVTARRADEEAKLKSGAN